MRLVATLALFLLVMACSTGGDGGVDAAGKTDTAASLGDDTPPAGETGSADAPPAEVAPTVYPTAYVVDVRDLPQLPAANAVGPDDPMFFGQQMYLYDTFGAEVLGEYPPADFMLSLMDDPEFGPQFERFGFIPDPNDEFPIGFKRGVVDRDRALPTCAPCHTAKLPDGSIWLGMTNPRIDMRGFRIAVNRKWVEAGNPPLEDDRVLAKYAVVGPGRYSLDSSGYEHAVPAAIPSLFHGDQRSQFSFVGGSKTMKTEIYLSVWASGPGNPNEAEAVIPFVDKPRLNEMVAFFGSMAPPPAPPQDPDRVARGAEVFAEARCNSCHHPDDPSKDGVVAVDFSDDPQDRYPGDDPEYPNGSLAVDRVQYEMAYGGDGASVQVDDRVQDIFKFLVKNGLRAGPTDGYNTLGLHGLWFSAPYLNNNSVPTLEDLLRPAGERPVTFEHAGFTVDTRVLGSSNAGHEFGAELSGEDKTALLAYLRSL